MGQLKYWLLFLGLAALSAPVGILLIWVLVTYMPK